MPRVESSDEQSLPSGGPRRPQQGPGKDRTKLWIALGVAGGILAGGLLAWMILTATGNMPQTTLPTTPTNTAEAALSANGEGSTTAALSAAEQAAKEAAENAAEPTADAKPPNTPKLTYPATNYWLSPDDKKIEIKWKSVSDASGVSYILEFSDELGGGAGWASPERTAKVKRLYYNHTMQGYKERYRIIAVDGAGNESAPSAYHFLIEAPSASEAASLNAGE
jgi:hypothetical protein